ncbi:hypothetical protein LCGC14_1540000 [marine sediment metagenome]|uniref:Uncharacterized protein n=1 Tax=marine sediment metagenome TaxID=412755 RepID=A0A0F9LU41_9ZZZZ
MSEINFNDKLYAKDLNKRIVVTPIISKSQINNGVIDLRLGTEFILTRKTKFANLDIYEKSLEANIKKYQEKITINITNFLILHPNQFILGSTLEYVKLPNDIIGYLTGRSSWGRLGLVIATATIVNPGFAGVITLELTNVGEVPISLYPGLRIAQLSFHQCSFKSEEISLSQSKYFGSTGPSFSEVHRDRDIFLFEKDLPDKA